MTETPLTQEIIDGTITEGEHDKTGLLSKAAKHPLVTGGLVLAGAGVAYAIARAALKSDESEPVARDVHVETSVAINKPAGELYAFWRDFANLARFMRNLESVTDLGEGKSHWVAKGISGSKIEWDAEIYNEIPGELIAWRSLENADIVNAGSVRFEAAPDGHGTYVRVTVNYNPPAGKIGATLAQLIGAEPSQLIKEDLRRFKQLMEAGEIATVEGQTSGRAEGVAPVDSDQPKAATMGTPEEAADGAAVKAA